MPSTASLTYATMDVATAIDTYAKERRARVSSRTMAYWLENARPLAAFFKELKLREIRPALLAAYQNARTEAGRAPKTINGELSVLRQVLKRAKLWYRFDDEYSTLRNRKPPVGRALRPEEQQRLFALARPERHLEVLQQLHDDAEKLGFTEPEHFVFPWPGRDRKLDPKRGMTSWRSAWRAMRKAAGLVHVRFHDGRHTAITTLAEKGLPGYPPRRQLPHRRPPAQSPAAADKPRVARAANEPPAHVRRVMSHAVSQNGRSRGRVLKLAEEAGSSGRTRTYPPSRFALRRGLAEARAQ